MDIDVNDIFSLSGSHLTKWGQEHIDDIVSYISIQLCELKKQKSKTFLSEWINDCWKGDYPVYNGSILSDSYRQMKYYGFSTSEKIVNFARSLQRDAENTVREECGIPKIGEGWVSETQLYYQIKNYFNKFEVIQHAHPKWLGRQHLDIFIPSLKLAIEYQGAQHFKPVEFFGGEKEFKKLQARDRKKFKLCQENNIILMYVKPGYSIEEVIGKIQSVIGGKVA